MVRAPGASADRLAAVLAGVWAGVLLCIGAIAAPAAFAVLPSADAGRVVGLILAREAPASLVCAVIVFLVARRRARAAAERGDGSVVSADMLLALGTLFCTVAGHYALQPMMAQARAGQGGWSFGALHAASMALFALKGVLVLLLAWRLPRPRGGAGG